MMSLAEQKVWDYIDGNLSSPEYERVRDLVAVDPVYGKLYDELLALNGSLNQLETDEPSMSFTRNVMQQLEHEVAPVRSLVDKRIVYGIAAFFVLTISAIVVIMLCTITWTGGAETSPFRFNLPELNFTLSPDSSLVRAFFLADIIIALYMLDSVLRKRLKLQEKR